MSDDPMASSRGPGSSSDSPDGEVAASWSSWSNLWQVPTILLSMALIGVGIALAISRTPGNDFDGALNQVDDLIAVGELETARQRLVEVIEPRLGVATDLQLGRFHATVADWTYFTQKGLGQSQDDINVRIGSKYERASSAGYPLSPARIERWAEVSIAADDLQTAREQYAILEAMTLSPTAPRALRERRNRILRQLVMHSLDKPDAPYLELMRLLDDYRRNELVSVDDRMWAIARQASLRLETGRYQEAIDRLLLESRRIEAEAALAGRSFGEFHTLFARAYYHTGAYDDAHFQLDLALKEFGDVSDPAKGEALLVLGQLAVTEGDHELARDTLQVVVRDYEGERCHIAAVLNLAEVSSVLGRHDDSIDLYAQLEGMLATAEPQRDVTPIRVANSLIDRHQASLAMGRLERSLRYIQIAETLFPPGDIEPAVLQHLATTHRQIADNLMGRSSDALTANPDQRFDDIDAASPEERFEANAHYREAGRYGAQHARAMIATQASDEAIKSAADSMWLAADSFDLGGNWDRAIDHFNTFIDQRMRVVQIPEALLRRGLAFQAINEHEKAVESFDLLLAEHPTTIDASRSHVPKSRSLVKLDRVKDALGVLQDVVRGQRLQPSSVDFRNALMAYGILLAEYGEPVEAITQLETALQRYPGDPRETELRFELASAYREAARGLDSTNPLLPPTRQREEQARATKWLNESQRLYRLVREDLADRSPMRLDRVEQKLLRTAHLYEADCAFELEQYDQAIQLYERTVSEYRNHHSSINALVQIVNCYHRLGNDTKARGAHERTLDRLRQLPDRAFDEDDALMDRKAWERWLESSPLGQMVASGQ
ncbi:MAG: tetratricopeptide repeat protein [Planctomycetota bacterium]